jgi:hypothetical protein
MDDEEQRRKRADQIREQIKKLKGGKEPEQNRAERESEPSKKPMSPRELIARRMEELDKDKPNKG